MAPVEQAEPLSWESSASDLPGARLTGRICTTRDRRKKAVLPSWGAIGQSE